MNFNNQTATEVIEKKDNEKKLLRKDINRVGLAMIIFFAGGVILLNVALVLLFKYPLNSLSYELKGLFSSIFEIVLMDIIIVFAAVFYLSKTSTQKFKIRDIYRKPQMPAKDIFKWVCIGLSVGYITNYVFTQIFSILEQMIGRNLNSVSPQIDQTWYSILITLFSIVIVAPFCEETLFRGGVSWSLRKYGGWFAAIVSGLMFGLAHANYSQMFFAMALGIINTLLIFKSKSIWPAIIVHFAFNMFGGASTFITTQINVDELQKAVEAGNIEYMLSNLGYCAGLILISLGMITVTVLGIIFMVKENNKSKAYKRNGYYEYIAPKGEVSLTTKEKWGVFFTSPAMMACLGLFISYTVARALWW